MPDCRLWVSRCLVPYRDAWEQQRREVAAVADGAADLLWLLEHEDVITVGRSGDVAALAHSANALESLSIPVLEVERGGQATYHGPGQLIIYPILDLRRHRRDLHWFLRQLEEVLLRALAGLGLDCGRRPGYTGVWVAGRKIASIGVAAKNWVAYHGAALNVCCDLARFGLIHPCGLPAAAMTSIERELGSACAPADLLRPLADSFAEVFHVQLAPEDAGPRQSGRDPAKEMAR